MEKWRTASKKGLINERKVFGQNLNYLKKILKSVVHCNRPPVKYCLAFRYFKYVATSVGNSVEEGVVLERHSQFAYPIYAHFLRQARHIVT